jgi:acetyl esterase
MNQLYDNIDEGLAHPFSNLLDNDDFSGLPPATIINAKCDPLCDHGAAYAKKLRNSGVSVTRTVYSRSIHGFYGTMLGECEEAMAETACALIKAFNLPKIPK